MSPSHLCVALYLHSHLRILGNHPPTRLINLRDDWDLRSLFIHFRTGGIPEEDARDEVLDLIAAILNSFEGSDIEEIGFNIPVDWCTNFEREEDVGFDEDREEESDDEVEIIIERKEEPPLRDVLTRDCFRALERVTIGVYASATGEGETHHDLIAAAEGLARYFQAWDARGILSVRPSRDM